MLLNLNKVSPTLYRSAAPNEEDVQWLNKSLGVDKVISLDQNAGNRIAPICQSLDIEHSMLPIDGSRASILNFLSRIDGELDSPKKILLHCTHGKDRSGLACALYRVKKDGWSPEKAIQEANRFGFCLGLDPQITKLFHDLIHNAAAEKETEEEDVSEAYDYDYGGGYGSFSYPGAPFEDIQSWAPRYDAHTFLGDFSKATPAEIEEQKEGGGGVAEWTEDGDEIVGIPDTSMAPQSVNPTIPGAGFAFPAVTYAL